MLSWKRQPKYSLEIPWLGRDGGWDKWEKALHRVNPPASGASLSRFKPQCFYVYLSICNHHFCQKLSNISNFKWFNVTVVWPWLSYLAFLCLRFLLHKMGIIKYPLHTVNKKMKRVHICSLYNRKYLAHSRPRICKRKSNEEIKYGFFLASPSPTSTVAWHRATSLGEPGWPGWALA